MSTAWFCDGHHIWTTGDCPKCDGELIALTEDEHFPWHYTGFGVICACGAAMSSDETCTASGSAE